MLASFISEKQNIFSEMYNQIFLSSSEHSLNWRRFILLDSDTLKCFEWNDFYVVFLNFE